jgi:hypothetical protein
LKTLKSLVALACLALAGCESVPVEKPKPIIVQRAEPRVNVEEMINPLKDYIYAQYDVSFGGQRADLEIIEQRMSDSLKKAKFSDETVQQIKDGRSAPELEKLFEKEGLVFRRMNFLGRVGNHSYELLKIESRTPKERTVFGITRKYNAVRIQEEVISGLAAYAIQKSSSRLSGIIGSHMVGTDDIEYRPWQDASLAKNFYEGIKSLEGELEEEFKDPDVLDKYVGRSKSMNTMFCDRVSKVLNYKAVREQFKLSKSVDEFVLKVVPGWEETSDIQQFMYMVDGFNFDKEVLDKLTDNNRLRLTVDKAMHQELRSMLARMKYGDAYKGLAEIFKYMSFDKPGIVNPSVSAAKGITINFIEQVQSDRDKYANISVIGYVKGTEASVCKQFGLLSEEQIRSLAKSAFENIYKSRSLNEYMQVRVNQLLKEQEKQR